VVGFVGVAEEEGAVGSAIVVGVVVDEAGFVAVDDDDWGEE
jgi:hypothetical protein